MLRTGSVCVTLGSMSIPEQGVRIYHWVLVDGSDRSCSSVRSCLVTDVTVLIRQVLRWQSRWRFLFTREQFLQAGRMTTVSGWPPAVRDELLADDRARVDCVLIVLQMFVSHSSLFGCQPFCVLLSITILLLNSDKVKDGLHFAEYQRLVLGFDSRKAS